ncbi:uncharacterized protein LOC108102095 [Drosophila ficusphila]|uniref:uncharacterized protein LOC108102095 n=1 Tax=Drosophila ficusphila TaxID=30025 RepID=UPI0007E845FB|nr:uncharacterized protein LOC108102095 [Drosophila ficusphila]
MSLSKVPHIVGDDDDAQEAVIGVSEVDENSNGSYVTSDQDEEISNEDETDLNGADWSMNVTYIAGTPKRAHSSTDIQKPDIQKTDIQKTDIQKTDIQKTDIPKTDTQKIRTVFSQRKRSYDTEKSNRTIRLFQSAPQVLTSPDISNPQESIGERVSKRIRNNPAALAKPVDITGYFHELSVELVEEGVGLKPFKALQKRIDRLVDQALEESRITKR